MTTDLNYTGDKLVCRRLFPDDEDRPLDLIPQKIERQFIENLRVAVPPLVESRMSSVSQVTMKDLWIGLPRVLFTRWQHSVGVYNLGEIWLENLRGSGKIAAHAQIPHMTEEATQVIVGYALLLHDYGHLCFSHLLEEALSNINWVPTDIGGLQLETIPLRRRLLAPVGDDKELVSLMSRTFAELGVSNPATALDLVLSLIEGTAGVPWLQALVNGPVDADKIDYLGRDAELLEKASYSVGVRLRLSPNKDRGMPWFKDFLSEQYINHSGFLCLPGRSALAAADMWRERVFLYDRFYLAPAIRAADRVALEILQHFLIRCVVSSAFADEVTKELFKDPSMVDTTKTGEFSPLAELMTEVKEPPDVRDLKYDACRTLLEMLYLFGRKSQRDFKLLTFMIDRITAWPHIEGEYRELLKYLFSQLVELSEQRLSLKDFVGKHVVRSPLQFPRVMETKVREIVRSLQHQHSADVLIDVCVLPRALAAPLREGPVGYDADNRFMQLLVPKGEVSKWGPGSLILEPLTPAKVKELERPYGRVTIVAPDKASARAKYVFDRVIGALRAAGIPIEEVEA